MLIVGAPIPRHPGQSCSSGAVSLVLLKKYEKRRSLTSVGRNTLVRPNRLWSTQADWRVHCEGYACEVAACSVTVQKPGCRHASGGRTPCASSLIRPSRRTLNWSPKRGLVGDAAEMSEIRV